MPRSRYGPRTPEELTTTRTAGAKIPDIWSTSVIAVWETDPEAAAQVLPPLKPADRPLVRACSTGSPNCGSGSPSAGPGGRGALGQDKADFSIWDEAKATGRHWLTGPDIPAVVGATHRSSTS